jgi:hypothetical protein
MQSFFVRPESFPNYPMAMKRPSSFKTLFLLVPVLCSLLLVPVARAGDTLIPNYSFESGLTSWTAWLGTNGGTIDTTQHYTGINSLKIVDGSTSLAYGMESAKYPVTPGITLSAYTREYIVSGSAELYMRFYTSASVYISCVYNTRSSPTGQWTWGGVSGTVPANAAYVSILLYSNSTNTGTIYFDDVYLTTQYTNLGSQVNNNIAFCATMGKNASNQDVAYFIGQGSTADPDRAVVYNVNTNTVEKTIDLPGALFDWAIAKANDGNIYFGTAHFAKIFKYVPSTGALTNLGTASAGQDFVYGMVPAGNAGKIYAGTYPDAKIFKYDPVGGFATFSPGITITPGASYVHAIDYDSVNNMSFVGLGSNVQSLVYYDNSNGNQWEIWPVANRTSGFVYGVNYIGGKVFARNNSGKMYVLNVVKNGANPPTVTIDATINTVGSLDQSPAINGKVYFTISGVLQAYDIAAKAYTSTGFTVGSSPQRLMTCTLTDQTNWPGTSLIMVNNIFDIVYVTKYNPTNGRNSQTAVNVAQVPTLHNSIVKGPDGNIYTSGYLVGGTGVYTTLLHNNSDMSGIGQCEGMNTFGNKIYLGVYPGGTIWEYDPYSPWTKNTGGTNPHLVLTIGQSQDRPYAMVNDGGTKLFAGTLAGYGELGGALTIYDTSTGTALVKRNIVVDQCPVALAYYNGNIYGGTTVSGGQGATPTQSQCRFFVYTVATDTTAIYTLPVANLKAITDVTVGPDNKIWGWAEGYLFVFNPSTNLFEYCVQKFSDVNYQDVSDTNLHTRDADMVIGKNGALWGTIHNTRLFTVDPSTKAVTVIRDDLGTQLIQDDFGNLYMIHDINLYRWAP